MAKIRSLSKVRPKESMDSVKEAKHLGNSRAFDILLEAQQHWIAMDTYRRERHRNKRYCYGDQWSDAVNVDGTSITEEEYIKRQGSVPLKNNLIRRLVKNVLGVYRSQSKEPTCTARDREEQRLGETMSTILQYNMQLNRSSEILARTMEEYLIGGLVVHRKWFGWRNNRQDCWTDYVQPDNFIIDTNIQDFRGWDCSLVGELHDISLGQLLERFAHSPQDYQRLVDIYSVACDQRAFASYLDDFGVANGTYESNKRQFDFLFPRDPRRCRVIEVWRKERKPRYRCHDYNNGDIFKIDVEDYRDMVEAVNRDRIERGTAAGMAEDDIPLIQAEWFMDDYWYYYYLSPLGDILEEGESPYAHKSHPYVFKAYPFIDGEIHSFVADVIDQQRYVNRLITMYDWIMRTSAKGVLMVPEQVLEGSGMTIDEIADQWARFNGVIVYKAKPGINAPQQIASNSTNIGINELLQIQLKFFEDISGVHGALQGRAGASGTSGTLYAQQAQNATTSLLDLLDSFSSFIVDGAYKDVKNMQQFYDDKRTFNIAGRGAKMIEYDPQKLSDVEFDISITESTSTPAYRDMAKDFLMQIWQSGQISLEQLLQYGDFPFADDLLQSIQSQKEQLEQGQVPQGISPELQKQVQQGANMQAVNQLHNAMQPTAA